MAYQRYSVQAVLSRAKRRAKKGKVSINHYICFCSQTEPEFAVIKWGLAADQCGVASGMWT